MSEREIDLVVNGQSVLKPRTRWGPSPIAWRVSHHPLHHHHRHLNRLCLISFSLEEPQPSHQYHRRHPPLPPQRLHPLRSLQVQNRLHLPHPQHELLAGRGTQSQYHPIDFKTSVKVSLTDTICNKIDA